MQDTLPAAPADLGLPEDLPDAAPIARWLTANSLRAEGVQVLVPPFAHYGGHGWLSRPEGLGGKSDDPQTLASTLVLFEDGVAMRQAHSSHADIQTQGEGRYSHWTDGVYFSTLDGSDPTRNGRRYVAVNTSWALVPGGPSGCALLGPYLHSDGHMWTAVLPDTAGWSDAERIRPSPLRLFEDEHALGPRNSTMLNRIGAIGGGAFAHWRDQLYFSTSDGSDPNTNGRRYTVAGGPPAPSTPAEFARSEYLERYYRKRELFFDDPTKLWQLSPRAEFFYGRGGHDVPPPIYANVVGLTSFCNLRCTICGSQESIDHEGVKRRHMKPEVMAAMADTIFPFLSVVILASLGEPTVYAHFDQVLEKAHQWGCSIKLESNATLLTPRTIELLTAVKGELFFSIDATGDLFESVRKGAKWDQVHANLKALMAARDPELTKMNMYPTVSRRTLPDMINVARVAAELGFDELTFHSYDPTMFAQEERPTPEEFLPQERLIAEWIDGLASSRDMSGFSVKVNGREINPHFSSASPLRSMPQNHPVKREQYEANVWRCKNPLQNVDIGPDGQVYPCVWSGTRPQENTMGYATSPELFAETWFGRRYRELRAALRHDSYQPINVAQCEACLERYA